MYRVKRKVFNTKKKYFMKKVFITATAMFVTISSLLLPACASRDEAPDPVEVQEQIAEYRNQELNLVRSTILDKDRAERLIDLIADRDRLIADHSKEVDAYRDKIYELNADYNVERKSFDAPIANYNSQRANAQKEFVSLVGKMKKETTAEEWKIISKYQLKRLSPRKLTYTQLTGGL